MPTPPRTSLDAIVRAGREVLDADGPEALTMRRVAAVVGVQAPSLYKHVRDRAALARLVSQEVQLELGAVLDAAVAGDDPAADLRAVAAAFRAYAHRHPGAYALLFARLPDTWRLEPDPADSAIAPLFRTVEALAGPEDRLPAARTVVAWASGFIAMELAGAFRMGGDVDAAFAYGADRIVAAIDRRGHQQATVR